MRLRLLNVPVDGGDLRVLLWGTGKRVAVAVHGITASGMSWQAVMGEAAREARLTLRRRFN